MEDEKKVIIEFAPGALDNFDGTQEELDEFIEEIKQLALSGELIEDSTPVDMEQLSKEDPEAYEYLMKIANNEDVKDKRRLH